MTRIAAKPTTYGSGDVPCSRASSSIVLPIAAIHGAAITLYQIAPSTKNTIDEIQTARCLPALTGPLLALKAVFHHRPLSQPCGDRAGSHPSFAGLHPSDVLPTRAGRLHERDVPFQVVGNSVACRPSSRAGGRKRDTSRPVCSRLPALRPKRRHTIAKRLSSSAANVPSPR